MNLTPREITILLAGLCAIDSGMPEYASAKAKLKEEQRKHFHKLRNEWVCWCSLQGLAAIDAREYLGDENLSYYQQRYVASFVERWEEVEG